MPNGDERDWPQCETCRFFQGHELRKACKLHEFTLPRIDVLSGCICRDYGAIERLEQDHEWPYSLTSRTHEDLRRTTKPGVLYEMFGEPPGARYEPLGKFDQLRNPWLHVSVFPKDRLGWAIPIQEEDYGSFPEPGMSSVVRLGKAQVAFQMEEVRRRRPKKGILAADGSWKITKITRWETVARRVWFCKDRPNAIGELFDTLFDVKAMTKHFLDQMSQAERLRNPLKFSVFVEVVQPKKTYAIRPHLGLYRQFSRA